MWKITVDVISTNNKIFTNKILSLDLHTLQEEHPLDFCVVHYGSANQYWNCVEGAPHSVISFLCYFWSLKFQPLLLSDIIQYIFFKLFFNRDESYIIKVACLQVVDSGSISDTHMVS